MLEITDYFPMTEWEKMRSFVSDCMRPDHILSYKKFFEWQFRIKPGDRNAKIICGWQDGKLLGMHGYIPLSIHWGDLKKPIQAAWTLHWRVRKEAPRGLGVLLTERIQRMYPLVLSVNASKTGSFIIKALGWSFFARIPRYICVLDKHQCIHMAPNAVAKEDLESFAFKSETRTSSLTPEVSLKKDNYHPEWQLYPDLAFSVIRSLEYLTWRYIEHPVFHYHIALEGKPQRPAVCVYRVEQTFGLYKTKVGRIVDFFYPNDNQGKNDGLILMNAVLRHMRNIGCAYADFICSCRVYGQILVDLGGGEEPEDCQILPVRLTPIEQAIRYQNLVFFASKKVFLPKLENTYITKSDVDGDSPASVSSVEEIKI